MKKLQGSKFATVLITITLGAALVFSGCSKQDSQSLIGPDDNATSVTFRTESTDSIDFSGQGDSQRFDNAIAYVGQNFTVSNSKTFEFNWDQDAYGGGSFNLDTEHGTVFQLTPWSMTAPPGTPYGAPVTITMEMEYQANKNQMLFTFGPHGCTFSPEAKVKIDYRILGGEDLPKLYYIKDNGDWELQQPWQINKKKMFMIIKLDHFSRYALVHA